MKLSCPSSAVLLPALVVMVAVLALSTILQTIHKSYRMQRLVSKYQDTLTVR